MTKLESTIERLRQLPADQQDAVAAEIDLMLDDELDDLLTEEQWAEIEARLDRPEKFIPHEEVVRRFKARYGE